nr:hypothetical protein [Bacteroides fragilis]
MDSKEWQTGGDKSNSLWIADFCPHPKCKTYIFCRSALDAMSFYQLNANKIKLEESVFGSVEGTFQLIK